MIKTYIFIILLFHAIDGLNKVKAVETKEDYSVYSLSFFLKALAALLIFYI